MSAAETTASGEWRPLRPANQPDPMLLAPDAANEPVRPTPRRRVAPILGGRIVPCAPEVEETALRQFVGGFAALATRLLLDGVIASAMQPSSPHATDETGNVEP
jgi:hypothetical protein